mmetsp:Transcript_6104/g.18442  ORF Transcript_6104/g.18442 Transcript_6104/m.18442 type:complete len:357 (-) Transcript_6104:85-1155(-)
MKEPGTMKAAVVQRLGEFEEVIDVVEDFPRPKLNKDTEILVRVRACSLSPGDFRRVRGDVDGVWNPKTPFVPGMDISGVVEEAGPRATLKVGDSIMASDGTFLGGLAEYAVVDSSVAQIVPASLSFTEASTLANSALRAKICVEKSNLRGGERVLVIGASGGLGTFLVQLLRDAQVSYIAVVSSQEKLLESLGVDRVINYQREKQPWFLMEEFEANPFDVVFDCVGGPDAWNDAKHSPALKKRAQGGLFFMVSVSDPVMQIHGMMGFMGFMAVLLSTVLKAKFERNAPYYKQLLVDGKPTSAQLTELAKLIEEKRLRVVLDPACPFAFTREGVAQAFRLQESRHAHGKIAVDISCD